MISPYSDFLKGIAKIMPGETFTITLDLTDLLEVKADRMLIYYYENKFSKDYLANGCILVGKTSDNKNIYKKVREIPEQYKNMTTNDFI